MAAAALLLAFALYMPVEPIDVPPLPGQAPYNYVPDEGYVPNAQTAVAIASAVLLPIYGKEEMEQGQPLTATLRKGIWIVRGTFKKYGAAPGGVMQIHISKKTGQILRVTAGM